MSEKETPKNAATRKKRTPEEIQLSMRLFESRKPSSDDEWNDFAKLYNELMPSKKRTVASLRSFHSRTGTASPSSSPSPSPPADDDTEITDIKSFVRCMRQEMFRSKKSIAKIERRRKLCAEARAKFSDLNDLLMENMTVHLEEEAKNRAKLDAFLIQYLSGSTSQQQQQQQQQQKKKKKKATQEQ